MTKLLFVCLGNICRSPAAEGVMQHRVNQAGRAVEFLCDSAGTGGWHAGERADPRMRDHASRRGYDLQSRARQVRPEDLKAFDWILAMDDQNYRDLLQLDPQGQNHHKVRKMTDFCRESLDSAVPDPYYGGDEGFEHVLDLLEDATSGLLDFIDNKWAPGTPR